MSKKFWSLIMMLCVAFVSLPLLATETNETIVIHSPFPTSLAETEAKELGFWVEAQTMFGKKPARGIVWFERDVTETFGFFAFLWKESDGYLEYLAGPTWKPFDGLQLGVGLGRESVREEGQGTRRMFFLDATRGDFNFYAAVENGKVSGPWKKITATYALNERVGLGVMHETGLGNGPRVEYNFDSKNKVQVWGALLQGRFPGIDDGLERKTTFVLGINFSF